MYSLFVWSLCSHYDRASDLRYGLNDEYLDTVIWLEEKSQLGSTAYLFIYALNLKLLTFELL